MLASHLISLRIPALIGRDLAARGAQRAACDGGSHLSQPVSAASHPIYFIQFLFLGNNFCLDLAAFISLVYFDQLAQHPISIYFMAEIFSAHNFDFLFFANMFAYMWRPSSYLINACSKEYLFQPFDIWWIMWWEYSGLLPHHEREQE